MKKSPKKLKLAKETLLLLESESLEHVIGATAAETNCKSGCTLCANTACALC